MDPINQMIISGIVVASDEEDKIVEESAVKELAKIDAEIDKILVSRRKAKAKEQG